MASQWSVVGGGGWLEGGDNETCTLEPEGREDTPVMVAAGLEPRGDMSANRSNGSKLRLPCEAATTCVDEGADPALGEGGDPSELQGTAPGRSRVREEMAATVPVDEEAAITH